MSRGSHAFKEQVFCWRHIDMPVSLTGESSRVDAVLRVQSSKETPQPNPRTTAGTETAFCRESVRVVAPTETP